MAVINILEGDITAAEVDAIVNAANPAMLGGGGVDGAIHRAAGPALLEACRKVPVIEGVRCPFGEARITESGNLPSKFVIHTAGPIYRNESDPAQVLESSYRNSLLLALEYQCESVALPAISCGVYGYPPAEAAKIALTTCMDSKFSSLRIDHYLFGKPMHQLWQNTYQSLL